MCSFFKEDLEWIFQNYVGTFEMIQHFVRKFGNKFDDFAKLEVNLLSQTKVKKKTYTKHEWSNGKQTWMNDWKQTWINGK